MSIFNSAADLGSLMSPHSSVGRSLKPGQVNGLISTSRSLVAGEHMMPGPGIRIDRGPNGVVISGNPKVRSSSTTDTPFQLYFAPNPDTAVGGSVIRVVAGLVNEVYPSLGGTVLTASPAPYFALAAGTVYLKAVGSLANDAWSWTYSVVFLTEAPTDETITTSSIISYRKVGTVAAVSGSTTAFKVATQLVTTHMYLFSYGNLNVWVRA